MYLLIGLGNPGKQYTYTRHNAGFLALDFLREHFGFESFHHENRFQCELATGTLAKRKCLLIKPATFMNHSGTTVRLLLDFYKLAPSDMLVIHDDLDLAPGTMKDTLSSRAAGHNGVQDIIDTLGTQHFTRIRLGIGRPLATEGACRSTHDYVLDTFTTQELDTLSELFTRLPEIVTKHIHPSSTH